MAGAADQRVGGVAASRSRIETADIGPPPHLPPSPVPTLSKGQTLSRVPPLLVMKVTTPCLLKCWE